MHFYIQFLLPRESLHPGKRSFDHLGNGGDFNARVGAKQRDGVFPLSGRHRKHSVKDQGSEHGAVFAATEAYQPGAFILRIELNQGAESGSL